MLWRIDIIHLEVNNWSPSEEESELIEYIDAQGNQHVGYNYCWTIYDMAQYYLITTTTKWLIDHGFESLISEAADWGYHLYSLKMYPSRFAGEILDGLDNEIYARKEELNTCLERGIELGYRKSKKGK